MGLRSAAASHGAVREPGAHARAVQRVSLHLHVRPPSHRPVPLRAPSAPDDARGPSHGYRRHLASRSPKTRASRKATGYGSRTGRGRVQAAGAHRSWPDAEPRPCYATAGGSPSRKLPSRASTVCSTATANNLTTMGVYGPTHYGAPYKSTLCKCYKVTPENDCSPSEIVTKKGGFGGNDYTRLRRRASNGLLIDYEFCTGCHTCEVACKKVHDLPIGQYGIKALEYGPVKNIKGDWEWTYLPLPTDSVRPLRRAHGRGSSPELRAPLPGRHHVLGSDCRAGRKSGGKAQDGAFHNEVAIVWT